jgi:hypothetical protein
MHQHSEWFFRQPPLIASVRRRRRESSKRLRALVGADAPIRRKARVVGSICGESTRAAGISETFRRRWRLLLLAELEERTYPARCSWWSGPGARWVSNEDATSHTWATARCACRSRADQATGPPAQRGNAGLAPGRARHRQVTGRPSASLRSGPLEPAPSSLPISALAHRLDQRTYHPRGRALLNAAPGRLHTIDRCESMTLRRAGLGA